MHSRELQSVEKHALILVSSYTTVIDLPTGEATLLLHPLFLHLLEDLAAGMLTPLLSLLAPHRLEDGPLDPLPPVATVDPLTMVEEVEMDTDLGKMESTFLERRT